MPRIRVTLTAIGLIIALSLLASIAEAQRSIRKEIPNPGKTQTPAPPATPAASTAQPATPDAAESPESEDRERRRQQTAEEIAARVARMGASDLLQIPEVQKELKLTERQLAQLKLAETKTGQDRRLMFEQMRGNRGGGPGGGGPGGGGPGGGGGFDLQAVQGAMANLDQQGEALIAQILQPAQRTRLKQILLRAKGPLIVATDPELAAQLRLYPIQTEKIRVIMEEMQMAQARNDEARRALSRGTRTGREPAKGATTKGEDEDEGEAKKSERGGRSQPDDQAREAQDKARENSEKIKEQAIQKIGAVLTGPQKTSFNKMLGADFDFSTLTLSSGRGGPGGDRGRGGRGR
jgi:hypothetical protein